jgi:hypothetical protein
MPYRLRSVLGCFLLSFVAVACGDDGSEDESPVSVDPVGLRIVSVSTTSGTAWTPESPVPLPLGCEGGLVVEVAVQGEFTLRPPGACRSATCGHVRVRAEPAAGEATEIQFSSRFGLLQLGSTASGLTTLHAELAIADGSVYLNADASPAAADPASIELLTAPADCSPAAPDDAAPQAGDADNQG